MFFKNYLSNVGLLNRSIRRPPVLVKKIPRKRKVIPKFKETMKIK